jgi:oligosaccharide repeat unit polymerase
MILNKSKRVIVVIYVAIIAMFLPIYIQLENVVSLETLSVSIYALTLMFVIILGSGRRALFNPIYVYCLMQLTIYSPNWISNIVTVDFVSDTLQGMSIDNNNDAVVKYFILSSCWIIVAFFSYLATTGLSSWQSKDSRVNYKLVGICIVIISFVSFLIVLEKFDSVFQMIMERQLTRADRAYVEHGRHFFLIAQSGVLGLLFWAVFDNRFYKSYFFWTLTLTTVLIAFLVSGNRTSILITFLMIYFSWFYHTRHIFSFKVILVTFFVVLMISIASNVREQGADFVVSGEKNPMLIDRVEHLIDLRFERSTTGYAGFGVISLIDDRGGEFLYGESYFSIFYIPIPGVMLENGKPYAGGRLAAKKLYNRDDTAWPIGHIVEAYWNFGYIGVVVNAIIFGFLAKTIRKIVLNNQGSVIVIIGYIFFIFSFALGSDGIYKFSQSIIPIILIYLTVTKLKIFNLQKGLR